MANPQFPVNLISGQWNKIATGVQGGLIHKKTPDCNYYQTYRLTGGIAPTAIDEGILMFAQGITEIISATVAIDIYVWATKDAILRVDI